MIGFDDGILNIIKRLQTEMYLVSQDKGIDCICKNYSTSQGSSSCQYCFGTGQKLKKIKKILGVRQPMSQIASGMNMNVEVGVYFFINDYNLQEDDYIVWNNEIEQITKVERFCSDDNTPVYYRCEAKKKKTDTEIFLQNLFSVTGKRFRKR